MAAVLKEVASAQTDTRGPHAIKPPNHVVERQGAAAATRSDRRATPAAAKLARLLAVKDVIWILVIRLVDARNRAGIVGHEMR